ncbi:hypothetical protein [Xanthomonas phaseoli]|uniref:hypothetical protein n=1 Tax=Xanthomonas phaseoli TaxID=1985254 RepID=UPI001E4F376B|nr:hypothetical protein [Xanthomonas phaseoli]MCC8471409.1 hypothetical protein [Xanthomonas phaseoli]
MAAKLWEDTVVTALRDAQWMNCKGYALPKTIPPGFVKLDGNAESALGDLLYSSGERYYLIEVKSGRDEISTEWLDRDGKYNEKKIYSSLKDLWEELENAARYGDHDEMTRGFDFFMKSISCHHAAYWSSWTGDSGATGEVVLEPYIAACIDALDPEKLESDQGIRKWNNNSFRIGSNINGTLRGAKAIPVKNIFDENSLAFSVIEEGNILRVGSSISLGLPLREFQSYVDTLVDRAGDGILDLHAIVLTDSGTTFKLISSTSDLKSVFDPKAEPVKSPELKTQIILPAINPSVQPGIVKSTRRNPSMS